MLCKIIIIQTCFLENVVHKVKFLVNLNTHISFSNSHEFLKLLHCYLMHNWVLVFNDKKYIWRSSWQVDRHPCRRKNNRMIARSFPRVCSTSLRFTVTESDWFSHTLCRWLLLLQCGIVQGHSSSEKVLLSRLIQFETSVRSRSISIINDRTSDVSCS